jgi:hypothetical protein
VGEGIPNAVVKGRMLLKGGKKRIVFKFFWME